MTPTVDFHPEAVEEARSALVWYRERSPAAAGAFVVELDGAITNIAESPDRWPEYRHGTRRYLMHRFPFLVVYRVFRAAVQVIAVAHARRRPRYWSARLEVEPTEKK